MSPSNDIHEDDDRPIYYLWSYDPDGNDGNGKVYMEHNEDRHPAHALTHRTLAPQVRHPEKVNGFAYSIEGGWRITNDEHKEVKDQHVLELVMDALKDRHPEPPLPHLA